MSQINRPPIGLQQLLGSQNFGDNPDDLRQGVVPTIDLTPFYGSGVLRVATITGSRTSEGIICTQPLFGTVMLIGASAWNTQSLFAAENCSLAITLTGLSEESPGATAAEHLLIAQQPVSWPNTSEPALGYTFPSPLVFENGVSVNARWVNYGGALTTVTLSVLYYDLNSEQN